mmetsp:Transcript_64032/g.113630  ORF Transcript_64032/g.113630 Transcript_64032/m.113630 type:complete len:86 (+) Transcript_64032:448-705(+)
MLLAQAGDASKIGQAPAAAYPSALVAVSIGHEHLEGGHATEVLADGESQTLVQKLEEFALHCLRADPGMVAGTSGAKAPSPQKTH